jgi:hypothetical protein
MAEYIKVSAKAKAKSKTKGDKSKAKSKAKASAQVLIKISRDGKRKKNTKQSPKQPPKPQQQIVVNVSGPPPTPLSDIILASQASKPSAPFQGASQDMQYMPTATQVNGDIPTASTFGVPTTNRRNQINNLRSDTSSDFDELQQQARAEFPQQVLDRFNEGLEQARSDAQRYYDAFITQADQVLQARQQGISAPATPLPDNLPTNLFGENPAIRCPS